MMAQAHEYQINKMRYYPVCRSEKRLTIVGAILMKYDSVVNSEHPVYGYNVYNPISREKRPSALAYISL